MGSQLGLYIFNFYVSYYGLLMVIGIIFAIVLGSYQIKKYNKDFNDFIIIFAMFGLFGIFGAKLLYIIVSFEKIDFQKINDINYINTLMSGGFVFYGGLIGGGVGLIITKYLLKIDVLSYMKVVIPILPLAHGFGRIGCSVVGCCYGRYYEGVGATIYRNSVVAPNNVYLLPVQLIEAFFNFLFSIILIIYINKYKGEKGLSLYLLLYGITRFILEFFRFDNAERGIYFSLSTSQYISIAIVFGLIIVEVYRKRKYYNK